MIREITRARPDPRRSAQAYRASRARQQERRGKVLVQERATLPIAPNHLTKGR